MNNKLSVSEANEILNIVKETGDFEVGFAAINNLMDKVKVIDEAVGVLIEGMEKIWVPTEHEGERFLDAVIRRTPLSPTTVRRHLDVKEFLNTAEIPEHVRPAIEGADQKSLIRIAKASDAYDFNEKDWEKIGESVYSGEKSVSMTIRKITKTAPRSNWLGISIDERGVLTVHANIDGEFVHKEMGRLNINNADPIVQKGIKRVRTCAGITDHVEY